MNIQQELKKELRQLQSQDYAKHVMTFFKTDKGEYAHGDQFLGIRVPDIRKIAKKYKHLDCAQIQTLIESPWHEERMLGLLIAVLQYPNNPIEIYKLYTNNFNHINNWDLVDISAYKIIGPHLENRSRAILYRWAKSQHLWTKRISIVSTLHLIKKSDFKETLKISEILLEDEHDLIHKAVGWCLREVGKQNKNIADEFLKKYYKKMPRTMLRYAIEKHPEIQRRRILKGTW